MTGDQPAVPAAAQAAPERYVKESLLGKGAWGVVHRARDAVIGRTVALKVIPFDPDLPEADQRELASRSEREARAAGALNHPNIVTIYDAGLVSGGTAFFIVMEYVEGETLRQRLLRGALPAPEAARIGAQVAAALQYAHERGIVHRDVKPANVLVRSDGLAKLADFGIARMESSELTRTGQSMGSPAYMSPEQALGKPVDARSDLFSLGVVLYEVLTGRKPFESESLGALCFQIVNDPPLLPSTRLAWAAPGWDAVIMKLLAKNPEERYASAAEAAADLERLERGEAPLDAAVVPEAPARAERTRTRSGPAAASVPPGAEPTLVPLSTGGAPARAAAPVAKGRSRASIPFRIAGRGKPLLIGTAVLAAAALLGSAAWRMTVGAGPRGTIRFEVTHGLKEGTVTVEVDGRRVWRQHVESDEAGLRALARRVAGRGLGHASRSIKVRPGEHQVVVTVESADGERWSDSTRRGLEADTIETLDVRVRAGLNAGMELQWK